MPDQWDENRLFYSIGEVADMFGVNPSLIRFWETEFDFIQPRKNKKGNRLFTRQDIEKIEIIYHLVKEKGYTLEGARQQLKTRKDDLQRKAEVITRLKQIREKLMMLRKGLE
ncbi:MAG: MerR family transcriptional regulator [Bacteroidales bacterium]